MITFLKTNAMRIAGAVVVVAIIVASLNRQAWLPGVSRWAETTIAGYRTTNTGHDSHDHGGHDAHDHSAHGHDEHDHAAHGHDDHGHDDHGHEGHDDDHAIELSKQAMLNVGLTKDQIQPVKLQTFEKSLTVPALIVEQPGRTRVQVATPMTGVITHVHALQGQAVEPGTLLFQIRLTHEDLVKAQTDFLQTLGELDVEEREIERLQDITSTGAVARKVLLEREYAKDKLTASLNAQREALRLHGLSDKQVQQIEHDRKLLRELQVFAPTADDHPGDELKLTGEYATHVAYYQESGDNKTDKSPLILQELQVHKGQSVESGQTLCVLSEYDELFIEGLAFEQDVSSLRLASENDWKIDAIFDKAGSTSDIVKDLDIAYLASAVDTDSRTLRFYVRLPNKVVKDHRVSGNRYVEWQFLPGQRLELRVPIDKWEDQIVLPVDAVAREGAEYFVFEQNHGHFDRVAVHVRYRDQYSAVIANDGALKPGDVVAMRGAHQLQMAMKNKAGGGVDPHAGHNH